MKIILLSTNRADHSALLVAAEALRRAGHETLTPMFRPSLVNESDLSALMSQLESHQPDLVVLHGDRWDAVLAAIACTMARIPIGHIGGGDETEGSYDNRFRNAITMMADYHFVSTPEALTRLVIDLGIDGSRAFMIGELAVDWLMSLTQQELLAYLAEVARSYDLDGPYILINWQPETASPEPNLGLRNIIEALPLMPGFRFLFTNPNVDTGYSEAARMIDDIEAPVRYARGGLTRHYYAAALRGCSCIVGNSSSGLIEAPVFNRPFVLVGERQTGRPLPPNTTKVVAGIDPKSLSEVMTQAAMTGESSYRSNQGKGNPYGDGFAATKLIAAIETIAIATRK